MIKNQCRNINTRRNLYEQICRRITTIVLGMLCIYSEPQTFISIKMNKYIYMYTYGTTGPPGGGKGTISERITKKYNYCHLSTGDILRTEVTEGTEQGKKANEYMRLGSLVPDSIVIDMIADVLEKKKNFNIQLDGYPRTIVQAEELDKTLKKLQMQVDLVLNLKVPLDEIVERISSRWIHLSSGRVYSYNFKPPKVEGKDDITGEPLIQRDDDKPEAVRKRLEVCLF